MELEEIKNRLRNNYYKNINLDIHNDVEWLVKQFESAVVECTELVEQNELNKRTLEEIKKKEWELAGEPTTVYLLAHYRLLGE